MWEGSGKLERGSNMHEILKEWIFKFLKIKKTKADNNFDIL